LSEHQIPIVINTILTSTIAVNVFYSYLVIKDFRYNSPKVKGKTDNQATRKWPCTYLIDRLHANITDKLIGEKELLVSFFARQVILIFKNNS